MPFGLLQRWKSRQESQAVQRRAIPDDLWKRTLVRYPFLRRRAADDAAELRRLTSLFLDRKEFNTVGGLKLTDAMAVAIAAQAVLPVLKLGLQRYDGFVGVVVHPEQVVARREHVDDDGLVHAYDETLSGEAMEGGPVMLSWTDVRSAGHSAAAGYNVVIHEFAHVLDMATGGANGLPLLPPDLPLAEWQQVLQAAFTAFAAQVDAADDAGSPLDGSVLDPYGTSGPEEFFAVASETFFVNPVPMQNEHPALYGMLVRFYRQDPAADTPPARNRSV